MAAEQPTDAMPTEGRLVFDASSEADAAVADQLYEALFPTRPHRRRSLYARPSEGDATAAGAEEGSVGEPERAASPRPLSAVRERPASAADACGGDAPPGEDWQDEGEEELSAGVQAVLARRQVTRERFGRRQRTVRELQRRCGQRAARGPPVWSPPVLLYRPPPLPALQRQLLEPGELADTVPDPPSLTRDQIQEFSRRHLETGDADTPR